MNNKPERSQIFALVPCWLWIFVLFPMFMPFVGLGIWGQKEYSAWLEIVYHAANGIVTLAIILRYLKEEWFMVTTAFSHYLKHIFLTVGLAAGAELLLLGILHLLGFNIDVMLEWLPVVEMSVSQSPLLLLAVQPIWGGIVMSVFSSIIICSLFYCGVFAPICYKEPWLAYVCTAVATLIPAIINILWRGETETFWAICTYIVQLPIHLVMCWSYQKTDNVWTPLLSLMVFNMLTSIALYTIFF